MIVGTTSEGLRVVEAELEGDDPREAMAGAEEHGADVLWVHGNADLTRFGFERRHGYARLHAEHTPPGEALPPLDASEYAEVLAAGYRGLWGHKLVQPDVRPPESATTVGLESAGSPVGLCRVFPAARLIDGPGVRAGHRSPGNYARLLAGGCAALGPGPADLDSWGDPPEVIAAYCELGFEIVEQTGGWELDLRARPRSGRRPT